MSSYKGCALNVFNTIFTIAVSLGLTEKIIRSISLQASVFTNCKAIVKIMLTNACGKLKRKTLRNSLKMLTL